MIIHHYRHKILIKSFEQLVWLKQKWQHKSSLAVAKAIGNAFRAVQNGISAARTYEELSRLSDRGLADIGLRREDIGRMVYLGSESRSAMAELKVCGYDTKVGHPSNSHASKYAA